MSSDTQGDAAPGGCGVVRKQRAVRGDVIKSQEKKLSKTFKWTCTRSQVNKSRKREFILESRKSDAKFPHEISRTRPGAKAKGMIVRLEQDTAWQVGWDLGNKDRISRRIASTTTRHVSEIKG